MRQFLGILYVVDPSAARDRAWNIAALVGEFVSYSDVHRGPFSFAIQRAALIRYSEASSSGHTLTAAAAAE